MAKGVFFTAFPAKSGVFAKKNPACKIVVDI